MKYSTIAFAVCLAGCTAPMGPGSDEIGRFEAPIVNGSTDNGDPAVVALTTQGQQFCSATLIRPTVVMTAAHCVPPNLLDFGITNYQQIDVFFGNQVGAGEFIDVVDGWTNLGWNDQSIENDMGLLRLSRPGPATPIDFNTHTLDGSHVGAPVRLVGFGVTTGSGSDSGTKRQGNTTIEQVFQFVFTMGLDPSGTCFGDSGGPTLHDFGGQEVVTGIHSRSDCATQATDTSVADYVNDILNFIGSATGPQCFADGGCATGCGVPDPDCPCAEDGFCTAACTEQATDPDCGPNCAADGSCNPVCGTTSPDPDCGGQMPGNCPGGTCDWAAGDLENEEYEGSVQTGCAASGERALPPAWAYAGVAALVALARRRRRPRD